MKLKLVLLFILMVSGSVSSQNKINIIGVWNLAENVASGLNDHYHFYSDGRFRFCSNEMDCSKRALGFEGKWKLDGDTLKLGITRENILIGGSIEKSTGSCASDSMIVGGKETFFDHEEYIVQYPIFHRSFDVDSIRRETLDIGTNRYWLVSADPETYH